MFATSSTAGVWTCVSDLLNRSALGQSGFLLPCFLCCISEQRFQYINSQWKLNQFQDTNDNIGSASNRSSFSAATGSILRPTVCRLASNQLNILLHLIFILIATVQQLAENISSFALWMCLLYEMQERWRLFSHRKVNLSRTSFYNLFSF